MLQDFDTTQYSDIDTPQKSKSFLKFNLIESTFNGHEKLFDEDKKVKLLSIFFIYLLLAKSCFASFFEHGINNLEWKIENFCFGLGVSGRLEVLLEYLDSKSLKTNDDIEHFICREKI